RAAEDISYWWTVNTHAGPGWQARCSATRLGAAEFKDIDISGMVFRHSSGRGAAGFVVASKAVIDDVSRGTVCPCPHTPVATFAGLTPDSLLIAGGNMNGAPTWVNAPWVGCDGDGSSPRGALAWYSFCAAVGRDGSAPATFAWADSLPADFGSYAVAALLPPTAPPPPPATGLTLEHVLQVLCQVYGW